MSNVEPPEGWTEEEYRDYFGEPGETQESELEFTSYTTVDVPEGTGEEQEGAG